MTKDEALKQALSTLANARDWIGNDPEGRWNEDEMYDELCNMVKFVSEALAEQPAPPPECQTEAEKTAFAFGWWKALEQKRKADSALDRMAENARELGLDYEPIVERVENSVGMGHKAWDMVEPKELAKAFHEALAEQPAQRTWVGLTHEDTYEATGTASTDLLDLAKLWSDNKVHVYQFDNEARKIIEAVLRRASAKLREKNA